MKLPPAALTAPTLCPRCDSPAIMTDYCIACTLPLGRCGSCLGVAGPFDRYCGFCGYELVRGQRRTPIWRLWLLAALVPLVAGIAFGVSPYSFGISRVATLIAPAPSSAPTPAARDATINVGYIAPPGWIAGDQSGLLVMARWQPDSARVASAQGALLTAPLQSSTIAVSRPALQVPVDSADPQAVLAFDLAGLLQLPPAGTRLEIARPVTAVTIGARHGAEAVLRATRQDGSTWYFERAYVGSGSGLVRVDALVPGADWASGDDQRVEAAIRSLRT